MWLYLLMTVRRTLELRVGDCRKSTRQRYSPSSRSSTLFRDRVAGSVTVRKYPRSSRISLSFQCDGTSECLPRTSKLWTNDNVNHSVKITSAVFCSCSRTDHITTFDFAFWAVAYRGGVDDSNPPEISNALQNRDKLNPIVKTVKNG